MLFKDKNGVLWNENDVNKLNPRKIEDLGLHQYVEYEDDFFD